jgi:hypothetical protein
MYNVQEVNKEYMIALILNMDNIIVIGKPNVLDLLAQEVNKERNKVDYYMEILVYSQFYILVKLGLYVMMDLMTIQLLQLAMNFMELNRKLFLGLDNNNVKQTDFG